MYLIPFRSQFHARVTYTLIRLDLVEAMRGLSDNFHPDMVESFVLLDNVNTQPSPAFHLDLEAKEAERSVNRFVFHFTPMHESLIMMAEIELRVLSRQCINRHIADDHTLHHEVQAWISDHNSIIVMINWRCSTIDTRVKLNRLNLKTHD